MWNEVSSHVLRGIMYSTLAYTGLFRSDYPLHSHSILFWTVNPICVSCVALCSHLCIYSVLIYWCACDNRDVIYSLKTVRVIRFVHGASHVWGKSDVKLKITQFQASSFIHCQDITWKRRAETQLQIRSSVFASSWLVLDAQHGVATTMAGFQNTCCSLYKCTRGH